MTHRSHSVQAVMREWALVASQGTAQGYPPITTLGRIAEEAEGAAISGGFGPSIPAGVLDRDVPWQYWTVERVLEDLSIHHRLVASLEYRAIDSARWLHRQTQRAKAAGMTMGEYRGKLRECLALVKDALA